MVFIAGGLLLAFVLWTAAVCMVDVQAIGPYGSAVGLAGMNGAFHRLTGVHMDLYLITDWLSLVPIGFVMGFAVLGVVQWVKRKHICKVDQNLLALGGFYIAVMAVYVFFEMIVVNHRPILIDGILEASYPSSTTVLVLCVMPASVMQLNDRIRHRKFRRSIAFAMYGFSALMVAGRLVSGVHWLSDMIGGLLISSALVTMYRTLTLQPTKK